MSILDAHTYDGPPEISCDLCIAGAGAAGLTLALALARTGRRIILLESGGLNFDGVTQSLYRGQVTGLPYFDLTSCRLRYFGGSTGHWGGVCIMPRRLDYEPRPTVPLPGWPVGYDEIIPYFVKAADQLGFDTDKFFQTKVSDELSPGRPAPFIEAKSAVLETETWFISQPGYRNFNPRYVKEVTTLPGVEVYLNANLTNIDLAENGRTVKSFTVKTLSGRRFSVKPKAGVIACHAIENARLLLASNDVVKTGIGNQGDQLGRNFFDHIHVQSGRLVAAPQIMPKLYSFDPILPKYDRTTSSHLTASNKARIDENLLHYVCVLDPNYGTREKRMGDAVSRLAKDFFRPYEDQMAEDVATLLGDPPNAMSSTLARLGLRERTPLFYNLTQHIEQWPNPDSRVTLLAERDLLGVPIVSLNFTLGEADFRTFARGQELVVRELSALGWGRLSTVPLTPDYIRQNVIGNWHHMGTTRMSNAPQAGVVDRDCRVHGTDNLYVAGSSIFPNATSAGPTIHLMAFAYRLAEHLEKVVFA
jgi:choline dehydrogenase-like flavoprotein